MIVWFNWIFVSREITLSTCSSNPTVSQIRKINNADLILLWCVENNANIHKHTFAGSQNKSRSKENSAERTRYNAIEHSKFNQNGKWPIIYGNFANPFACTQTHSERQIIVITGWFDYKLNNKIWKINKFFTLALLIAQLLSFGAPIERWWTRRKKTYSIAVSNMFFDWNCLSKYFVSSQFVLQHSIMQPAVSNSCP